MTEKFHDYNEFPCHNNGGTLPDSGSHYDTIDYGESSQQALCFDCLDIGFQFVQSDNGYLAAENCHCNNGINLNWKTKKRHECEFPSFVESVRIPNLFIEEIKSESFDQRIKKWILSYINGKKQNNALFLTGGTGTGKTASACGALALLIKSKNGDTDCFQVTCKEIIDTKEISEGKKRSNTYTEHAKRDTRNSINKYKYLIERIKSCEFLVLDELGQDRISLNEQSNLFDIIDQRITSCKPTIFISNHAFNKDQSLNKYTIDKYLGERILSRLKFCQHYHFDGQDRRAASSSILIITEKEKEEYMLPRPVLNQKNNEQHIMTWLTRNPAFEVVSTQKRKSLTFIDVKGEKIDMDRPEPIIYENVWAAGDILKIHGPVCDHEDKKLYATLLKELSKQHEAKKFGLVLEISLNSILNAMKFVRSGENVNKVKRQLNRLVRMSMSFKNSQGHRWDGPLLTEILYRGSSSDQKVYISFSHFMVSFYKLSAYTSFDGNISKKLKGDSSAFYLFYSSHSKYDMCISVEKCKKMLGIDKSFDRKEARRRVKNAVDNLIEAGVMDSEKTYIKDGKVYTSLAPANISPSTPVDSCMK